jgi:site-specific DNA-cytosine methylase
VLSGGFPCQDISYAGKGEGIDGERSGLWSEYARIIRELRPRYVVVENVAALLGRGMERVLGDLAAIGYDAEWQSIRASDVGAPHRRERIWIVAHGSGEHGGTRRARKHLKQACEACGQTTSLIAHHVDQDKANNAEENIQTLCKHCHDFWHAMQKRRGLVIAGRMPRLF